MHKQELEKQFERQIKENELLIYKVCRMYSYTDEDRKDLFQEIIIQLWKAYTQFKGEAKFTTWMYRVAINTAISRLRKEKNSIFFVELTALPAEVSDQNDSEVKEEYSKLLYTAIEMLNEIEKAVIMLYLEDKSYEEMEEILGVSQVNLRVKMNRIKEKLRQLTK